METKDTLISPRILCPKNKQFRHFQRAGINHIVTRKRSLLADEMGLGKTIQAIGAINFRGFSRVLIICPASLKINWLRELEAWSTQNLTIGIGYGSEIPQTDILIINYDIVAKNLKELQSRKWECVIYDEAHYLKNPKAKRTKAALDIKKTQAEIFLTGTPIPNKVIDIWTIAARLDPTSFGKFWPFAKRYANAHQTRFGWDFSGARHLDELRTKLVAAGMLARKKADVLTQLPDKIYQVLELPNTPSDSAAERELRSLGLAPSVDGLISLKGIKAESIGRIAELRQTAALAKVPHVADLARSAVESSGKVVIFAHHKAVVAALAAELAELKPLILTGETPALERDKAVTEFQQNPDNKVFIGSITAAGVGITLTAASIAIFAEIDWSPGNMRQAEDRLHRIGQLSAVLIQYVVAERSIDANIAKTLARKTQYIERVVK